ncbi:RNA polymerase sigma factor [Candidatus Uabimicrobium sp. HlEnr_7]|uniref:RNA polymerase sigma factor n=1 Tax=Candidatus Uabimicrobium helgolandensis TaxID=3095367 RepID=UPI003558066A
MTVHQNEMLISLAQTGDRDALNKLFIQIQQPIFRYLKTLTKDNTLAEDLLQEVFIVIFKKLWLLKEPKAFVSWTYRIANRIAVKRLKKEKSSKILFQSDWLQQQEQQETHCIEFLGQIDVINAIEQTSSASRPVLFLRFVEEKSLKEIAAILEIPLGTVKSRLFSGIAQLKKHENTQLK